MITVTPGYSGIFVTLGYSGIFVTLGYSGSFILEAYVFGIPIARARRTGSDARRA